MSYTESNKFDVAMSSLGDSAPFDHSTNDQPEDYAHDSAGVPNVDRGSKTEMNMGPFENKYPRQTGHDTAEDLTLT